MNKSELRKKYLSERKALSQASFDAKNQSLQDLLASEVDVLGELIHVFIPIRQKREVNTWPIIHEYWKKGLKTCTSITDFETNRLKHLSISESTQFVENKWGVPEPTQGEQVLLQEIDVVLMPMLCFDLGGNRVGYGKGYYDRFLSECRPDVRKIGLCLANPIKLIEDASLHDIKMDICVTPDKVYRF
ncbi:MAG: 5-formyltetrahydrofolate cyclo-ligase [Bacteroidota bacterium]